MGSKVGNGVTSSGTTRKDTFERKTQHRPRSDYRTLAATQPSGPKQAQLDEMAQATACASAACQ